MDEALNSVLDDGVSKMSEASKAMTEDHCTRALDVSHTCFPPMLNFPAALPASPSNRTHNSPSAALMKRQTEDRSPTTLGLGTPLPPMVAAYSSSSASESEASSAGQVRHFFQKGYQRPSQQEQTSSPSRIFHLHSSKSRDVSMVNFSVQSSPSPCQGQMTGDFVNRNLRPALMSFREFSRLQCEGYVEDLSNMSSTFLSSTSSNSNSFLISSKQSLVSSSSSSSSSQYSSNSLISTFYSHPSFISKNKIVEKDLLKQNKKEEQFFYNENKEKEDDNNNINYKKVNVVDNKQTNNNYNNNTNNNHNNNRLKLFLLYIVYVLVYFFTFYVKKLCYFFFLCFYNLYIFFKNSFTFLFTKRFSSADTLPQPFVSVLPGSSISSSSISSSSGSVILQWLSLGLVAWHTVFHSMLLTASRSFSSSSSPSSHSSSSSSSAVYSSTGAALLSEFLRVVISIAMMCREGLSFSEFKQLNFSLLKPTSSRRKYPTLYLLLLPCALYSLHNGLQFLAASHVDAFTIQLLAQLRTVVAAVGMSVRFNSPLSYMKWFSISFLTFGLFLFELSSNCSSNNNNIGANHFKTNPESSNLSHQLLNHNNSTSTIFSFSFHLYGVFICLISAVCSGLASVFMQEVMQHTQVSFWKRNYQICFVSFLVTSLLTLMNIVQQSFDSFSLDSWTALFTPLPFAAVLSHAVGGFCVAAALKWTSALAKSVASACSLVIGALILFAFPGSRAPASAFQHASIACVLFSSLLYTLESNFFFDYQYEDSVHSIPQLNTELKNCESPQEQKKEIFHSNDLLHLEQDILSNDKLSSSALEAERNENIEIELINEVGKKIK